MKKNNRGFIATAVLYSLVILIAIILFLILKNLSTTRKIERDSAQTIKEKLVYYEVVFDGNGSTSGSMDKIRLSSGKEERLPKSTFEKIGYSFAGWALEAEGEALYGDEGIVRNLTEAGKEITLYAKYAPNIYTITFNPNGGTITTPTKNVTYDSAYGTLPIPTKTDYDFLGWFTAPTGGTKVDQNTIVKITENQTLYAHWELSGHKVTYNYSYNGGTSTTAGSNVRIKEGANIPLTPTAAKSGYVFVGWNTNANATSKLSSLKMGKNDVTLYAIYYKKLTVTLYDYSGGSRGARYVYPIVWNRSTASASTQLPYLRTASNGCGGYTSLGWSSSSAAGAGVNYSAGGWYSFTGNTTLYGRYQQETIFYIDPNGGSAGGLRSARNYRNLSGSGSLSNNGPYSYYFASNASRGGKKFLGWNCTTGDCRGGSYYRGSSVSYTCTCMYSAFWR